jgi:hypothetical protein
MTSSAQSSLVDGLFNYLGGYCITLTNAVNFITMAFHYDFSYTRTSETIAREQYMDMEKNTVGKCSRDLLLKEPETRDPIELQREMQKGYEDHIVQCIARGKKDFSQDFFLVVLTKKERLMQNVLRNYFTCRLSCPTPEWDQTVYHYHRKEEILEFLWVVPSKYTCELFRSNMLSIDKDERDLLRFVLDFEDGTLMRRSKQLNGESASSIIISK